MKLVVLLLFLVANSIGKPLKTVNDSTEFENGTTWELVTSEKTADKPKTVELFQSRGMSLIDERKSSIESSFGFKTAEKPKYEQKDGGISFLEDAELNITLPNGKLKLSINDPSVRKGDDEKSTSFCFKAKTAARPTVNPQCPVDYCEVQFGYGILNGVLNLNILLGNEVILALVSTTSASVDISPTQMFVVGKESEKVTVCQFDLKEGFIPVKLVNKGDRSVTLEGAVIHGSTIGDNSLQIGSILWITAGVFGVVGVGVGIFLVVYCCFCKKKQPKIEANAQVDEKVSKNPVDELDKTGNKINVGKSEKNDKKEQSKKSVDPKIEKEIAAEENELLSELSENPEKETLDWMTNEIKTLETLKGFVPSRLRAFCYERKRQERTHVLLPNGLYQRTTLDNIILSNVICNVKTLKTKKPMKWDLINLCEISADPINYLTALEVISPETEVVLHRFINLFSTTELNFSTIFTHPKNFIDEVERVKLKYVKALKAAGLEDGKLPPVKLVKELEKRKVMARMAACSIVLGPILDTFEFTFENPLIFLAPFPFLMVLLIRKLVPYEIALNVYEVIRYRLAEDLKSREQSNLAPIFCSPHPVPAAAYAYYLSGTRFLKLVDCLILGENKMIDDGNYKEIWDKTVSNARDASSSLVNNIKEWMEKNGEHEISTTAVEGKKNPKKG